MKLQIIYGFQIDGLPLTNVTFRQDSRSLITASFDSTKNIFIVKFGILAKLSGILGNIGRSF